MDIFGNRLSSRQARLDRRCSSRAQAADLRHHLARRRADRAASRDAEHDAAGEILAGAVFRARGRDRCGHRFQAQRVDHRCPDRRADGRASPLRRHGACLWCRDRRDQPFGHPVTVPRPDGR